VDVQGKEGERKCRRGLQRKVTYLDTLIFAVFVLIFADFCALSQAVVELTYIHQQLKSHTFTQIRAQTKQKYKQNTT